MWMLRRWAVDVALSLAVVLPLLAILCVVAALAGAPSGGWEIAIGFGGAVISLAFFFTVLHTVAGTLLPALRAGVTRGRLSRAHLVLWAVAVLSLVLTSLVVGVLLPEAGPDEPWPEMLGAVGVGLLFLVTLVVLWQGWGPLISLGVGALLLLAQRVLDAFGGLPAWGDTLIGLGVLLVLHQVAVRRLPDPAKA